MVPTLTLHRTRTTDQGTPGALFRPDGSRLCLTLELPWRDNRRMHSSIPPDHLPAGLYQCRFERRPKFGPVYHILNVPGRDGVLIHSGNVAGDVDLGFKSHVQGCVLTGLNFGRIDGQFAIFNSMTARQRLQTEMAGQPFYLEVTPWTSVQF